MCRRARHPDLESLLACGEDTSKYARGRGLEVAQLSAGERARIYAASLGGAFDIDPGLSLLVDTTMLTRVGGEAPGGTLGSDVRAALRGTGVTKGECAPQRRAPTRTPVCRADLPGYVVRFSEVFAMAGDSVQTHLLADRYDKRKVLMVAQVAALDHPDAFSALTLAGTRPVAPGTRPTPTSTRPM